MVERTAAVGGLIVRGRVSSFGVLRLEWRAEAGTTVVALVGEIDITAVDVIEGVAGVAAHAPKLVLDLENVAFVDPSGLRLLQQLTALPNVTVRAMSPTVKHLLDALGLVEL